jgi:hypothetical protein
LSGAVLFGGCQSYSGINLKTGLHQLFHTPASVVHSSFAHAAPAHGSEQLFGKSWKSQGQEPELHMGL